MAPTSRWAGFAAALALALLWVPPVANAVIIASGDGSGNTDVPPNDPGWDNVGQHGGSTLVYLGNRWAITVNHIDPQPVVSFAGQDYAVVEGSEVILNNPSNEDLPELTSHTDLRMLRLQEDPGLPLMPISSTTPDIDSDVTMIGRGRDRAGDLTMWSVDRFGGEWIWTETGSSPFDQSGYEYDITQTMRWGTNVIEDDTELDATEIDPDHVTIATVQEVDVISIATRFDELDGTPFEGQAALRDSGGGVFYQNNGVWELAGIMFAVGVSHGQPDDTAVFGNFTLSADLASYHDEIERVMTAPPPLRAGDANQDYSFDQRDIVSVLLGGKYLTGQPATWGDGDWDGAPGGSPGDPPVGDGVFNQFDVIASQQNPLYLSGPYAALGSNGQIGDQQPSVIYNASTGEVSVDAPSGIELTSISIDSSAGVFTGAPAENLGGSFDNDADNNVFKATFGSSFGSLSFGNVAATGLDESFLLGDLTVIGSLAGGGGLGDVDLVYVPEPANIVLLALGVVCLCSMAWKGRRNNS